MSTFKSSKKQFKIKFHKVTANFAKFDAIINYLFNSKYCNTKTNHKNLELMFLADNL